MRIPEHLGDLPLCCHREAILSLSVWGTHTEAYLAPRTLLQAFLQLNFQHRHFGFVLRKSLRQICLPVTSGVGPRRAGVTAVVCGAGVLESLHYIERPLLQLLVHENGPVFLLQQLQRTGEERPEETKGRRRARNQSTSHITTHLQLQPRAFFFAEMQPHFRANGSLLESLAVAGAGDFHLTTRAHTTVPEAPTRGSRAQGREQGTILRWWIQTTLLQATQCSGFFFLTTSDCPLEEGMHCMRSSHV